MKVYTTCLNCGKLFLAHECEINRGGGKYCSKKCSNIARKLKKTYKCEICGKEFPFRSHGTQGIERTCSKKCGYILRRSMKGELNPAWKGGTRKRDDGYIEIYSPNHPYKNKTNQVMQHRLVMEKYLGCFLSPKLIVHHINEVRDDNRIENLMVVTKKQHQIIHVGKREAA
jgi:hypothetical protein